MPNWASGATGAASGAAAGSAFGPWGAAIGGVAGGAAGLFGGGSSGRKHSTMDKRQKGLYKEYHRGLQGEGQFANLFNFDEASAMKNFQTSYANPAMKNWQENMVPGITGSFRGGNLQDSSYLGGALAKSGADIQTDLNAKMADMLYSGNQSAMERRLKGLNDILNMQTFAVEGAQPNPMDSFSSGMASGIGKYAANRAFSSNNPNSMPSGGNTPSTPSRTPAFNYNPSAQNTSGKFNLPTFMGRP